jgi:hypothetical protein
MYDHGPKKGILTFIHFSILVAFIGALTLFMSPRFLPAGEIDSGKGNSYRVLPPIESGELMIFPVVRSNSSKASVLQYITLD